MPSDFGSTINLAKFNRLILDDKVNIQSVYYLTSMLSLEADRCKLHGESILHYILFVLKISMRFLIRLIIRILAASIELLVLPPYCFITWGIIAAIIFIYGAIYPIVKEYWNEINTFICDVEDVGIDGISFTLPDVLPFVGGDKFSLLPRWYPFADIINGAFGPELFDCSNKGGDQWNNIKHGKCQERFAGGADNCYNNYGDKSIDALDDNNASIEKHQMYATDYTLWDYNTRVGISINKLCNNKLNCPYGPENYMVDGSAVHGFSPIISTGIGKGTSPFKFIECCDGDGQNCTSTMLTQAKNSINYASRFPWGTNDLYGGQKEVEPLERTLMWPWSEWSEFSVFGPFKPITMYQATNRYFMPNATYAKGTAGNYCIVGSEMMLNIKYAIWFFVIVFIIYEIYSFIYDIHYAYDMVHTEVELKAKVDNYLRGKNIGDSVQPSDDKIDKAVTSFISEYDKVAKLTKEEKLSHENKHEMKMAKGKGLGYLDKLMHSHKLSKDDCLIENRGGSVPRPDYCEKGPGTTTGPGPGAGTGTGPGTGTGTGPGTGTGTGTGPGNGVGTTGLDDKQTIVFGFIMVITFIILGLVSITTILKKRNKKNKK